MSNAKVLTCETCGVSYDTEEYSSPIRSRRLLYFMEIRPRISQRYHEGTHIKSLAHSIDFAVPIGTPVRAAKDGVVVETVSHFIEGREDDALRYKANYICIRHDGGRRYSRYYHLNSVSVSRGEEVKAGNVIGISGNTGYTMGPHLHFDVVDVIGSDIAKLTMYDQGKGVEVPCLPMTFSKQPFPKTLINLPLHCADPLDLSEMPHVPFEEAGFGLLAVRGGNRTFLQKAQIAESAGAKLLIIVDNDASMKDAMPVVVGELATSVGIWVLFISFSNLNWTQKLSSRQERETLNFQPRSCTVSLVASPYFHPRSVPDGGSEIAPPFCKPVTFPVRVPL